MSKKNMNEHNYLTFEIRNNFHCFFFTIQFNDGIWEKEFQILLFTMKEEWIN
jgi:hypothetical protein